MNFRAYLEAIEKELEKMFPKEHYKIEIKEVLKNNDQLYHGLAIFSNDIEKSMSISPTVYLEGFYEEFENGKSIYESALDIVSTIKRAEIDNDKIQELTKNLKAENVVVKLVGMKDNQERLQNLPHVNVEDMAKEYIIMMEQNENSTTTVSVTYPLMKVMGFKNIEELDKVAMENTRKLMPAVEENMLDILKKMGIMFDKEEQEIYESAEIQQIIVSNMNKSFGANAILDIDLMKRVSERENDNLVVLPSSVHECILLKASNVDLKEAQAMVKEINHTQVEKGERLTDSVYVFDREALKLELAYNDMIKDILEEIKYQGIDSELLAEHAELYNNKSFMLQAIEIDTECVKICSDRLKEDKDILRIGVSRNAERLINADRNEGWEH